MTSNKEWLDNLAATDPQALQAWFDAPRADYEQVDKQPMTLDEAIAHADEVGQGDSPCAAEHRQLAEWLRKVDTSVTDCGNTREQLERDIDYWVNSWTGASVPVSEIKQAVGQWLDRQAAITEYNVVKQREEQCSQLVKDMNAAREMCSAYQDELSKLKTKLNQIRETKAHLREHIDNLAQDLAESERLREEMREELSIAYDHAHDLLARRDRGLA